MSADSQLWALTSRHSIHPLCNLDSQYQESLSILGCVFSTPQWCKTTPLGWGHEKKKPQKTGSLMCEKFLGCFLNSLTGVSWRMLCNSQVSLMTWKQLRRRWVLMAISLWTFFSSLITFLLSRWAERFCCTVTERNIPLPCIWRKSRSANTHWFQWIPQYLYVQSRKFIEIAWPF